MAAEINRGGGRKTLLCQMWKNPTFIGVGVKIFINAVIPPLFHSMAVSLWQDQVTDCSVPKI